MKFFVLLSLLSINSAFATDYILNWKNVPKTEDSFKKVMKENECHELKIQENAFKNVNKKSYEEFQKNNKIRIQNCKQEKIFTDEELGITEWKKIVIKKGFVLSVEMNKLGCKDIFTKQIFHTQRKNNMQGRNLNKLSPDEELQVQSCLALDEEKKKVDKVLEKIFRVGIGFENFKNFNNEEYNSFLKLGYDLGERHSFLGEISSERMELGYLYKSPFFLGLKVSGARYFVNTTSIFKPDLLLYIPFKYVDIFANYSLLKDYQEDVGFGLILKIDDYSIEYRYDNYLNQNIFSAGFKF